MRRTNSLLSRLDRLTPWCGRVRRLACPDRRDEHRNVRHTQPACIHGETGIHAKHRYRTPWSELQAILKHRIVEVRKQASQQARLATYTVRLKQALANINRMERACLHCRAYVDPLQVALRTCRSKRQKIRPDGRNPRLRQKRFSKKFCRSSHPSGAA